jgi:hypothetical protein
MLQYLMAHTFRHYGFMERMVATLFHLLTMEIEGTEPPGTMISGRFRIA